MLIARFDGGCIPNPKGHASSACFITRDGNEVFRQSKYLGFGEGMTNNVAEFEGVKMILQWYMRNGTSEPMRVIGDSQVVIWRMMGKYRKSVTGTCAEVANECLEIKSWLPWGAVTFEWQARMNNDECDAMCDLEIEEAQNKHNLSREGVPYVEY